MNAFEYAMNMEMDGKKYYLEQAANMTVPALKKIFEELAVDEQHHYDIFKALSEGKAADVAGGFKTTILETAKNVFQKMSEDKTKIDTFPGGVKEAWEKAREIEEKSEKFYLEQAGKADDDKQKAIWTLIASEEHKHWVAMENIVNFIDRPSQWLEDAEWSNLDNY